MNFDVDTTIENSNLNIRQIGTEPLEFMTDLQQSGMLSFRYLKQHTAQEKQRSDVHKQLEYYSIPDKLIL